MSVLRRLSDGSISLSFVPKEERDLVVYRLLLDLKQSVTICRRSLWRVIWSFNGLILVLGALVVATVSPIRLYIYVVQHDKYVRAEAVREGTPFVETLRAQLAKSIGSAYNLAAMIQVDPGMASLTESNFDQIADTLINTYGGITNLQLAPCAVVQNIYPLAGNEKAIGHALLKDDNRREAAVQTIINHDLTFVGPLNLIQGGVAIIGRYPAFTPSANCNLNIPGIPSDFWGYTTMLTTIDDFLKEIRLDLLGLRGYNYALSEAKFGVMSGAKTMVEPVSIPIVFTDPKTLRVFAEWQLEIEPIDGWALFPNMFVWQVVLFIFSMLMTMNTACLLLLRAQVVLEVKRLLHIVEGEMEPNADDPTKPGDGEEATRTQETRAETDFSTDGTKETSV